MADSKLRLQIITALDAVGLKATKQQIDGIQKSIKGTGNSGVQMGQKLGGALNKLPGLAGDIAEQFGKIG